MKKELIVLALFFAMSLVVAQSCELDVTLLNQDPYPAVQGDYVKLVFQIDGLANSDCGYVDFELLEKYPISFDAGQQRIYSIDSGTYTDSSYENFFMPRYEVRVSADALDGANPIEVIYHYGAGATQTKDFDLEVQDVRAEFEIFVSDYNSATNEITLEILNIGTSDIEALTMELDDQDGLTVIGTGMNNIGDLDSNEDTSADFKANIKTGSYKVNVKYSDSNGERRSVELDFDFNKEKFPAAESSSNMLNIIIGAAVVLVIVWLIWKRKKKKARR